MPTYGSRLRRPQWLLASTILLLHGLLALGLAKLAWRSRDVPRAAPAVHVRLIPLAPRSVADAAAPPVRATEPAPIASLRTSRHADVARAPSAKAKPAVEPAASLATAAPASSAIAASAPTPLLDSEASRRAIRLAARQGGLAARADADLDARGPTRDETLSTEMRSAAKGDCMKGQYTGAGMGLLSLPFLAAAVVRGNCAQ